MKIKLGDFAWALFDNVSYEIRQYHRGGIAWKVTKVDLLSALEDHPVRVSVLNSEIIRELF